MIPGFLHILYQTGNINLIISKLSEVFVYFLQTFFDAFCLMADRLQQSFRYELGSNHGIKKGIAVYGHRQQNGCILCKQSTWFIGDDDNGSACIMGHLCGDFINRRISWETEDNQTVFFGNITHMINRA